MRKLGKLVAIGALVIAGCGGSSPAARSLRSLATPGTGTAAPRSDTTINTETPTALGTREDPIPAGKPVRIGDWQVEVLSATTNATKTVLAENEFNSKPEAGNQFVLIEVAATYVGTATDSLFGGVTFSTVGAGAVGYSFAAGCGVIPDEINEYAEVFPGGTVRGNMCWQVANDDAASLVLVAEPSFSFEDTKAFLELPSRSITFEPPPVAANEPSGGAPGTRGNPYPQGETVPVGDWAVTVLETTPDAAAMVAAENPYNDPPLTGHQFFIARISATYEGEDAESMFLGLTLATIGQSAVVYGSSAYCGVIPDPVDEFADVYAGGAVRGNICWQVPSEDAESLVLMVDSAFSFEDERIFMSLHR